MLKILLKQVAELEDLTRDLHRFDKAIVVHEQIMILSLETYPTTSAHSKADVKSMNNSHFAFVIFHDEREPRGP